MVGVRERVAGQEHGVGALGDRARTASRTSALVPVPLEVDAPERQPDGRDPEDAHALRVLLAPGARQPRPRCGSRRGRPSRRSRRSDSGSQAKTVRSSTRAPARAQRAIAAPSESTPSSRCGETTTIRAICGRPAGSRRHYDRGLGRLATIRPRARCAAACVRLRRAFVDWRRRRPPKLGAPPAHDADRPELGLRARDADRPRLRRALHRRPRGRHPRPRPRDRRAGLHVRFGHRRRVGRHPDGERGQPGGDDRRRPRRRAAHPGRHLRLRDRHADAPVRLRRARGARHAPPDPRSRRRPARDRPRDHEDLAARGRDLGRVVALHLALREAARGGGLRRGAGRGAGVRQRPDRGRLPLRPRRVGPEARGARRPRPALRGDRRASARSSPRTESSRPSARFAVCATLR